MKKYRKPQMHGNGVESNVVPAALGAAALTKVGAAFAVGVASGLMKDNKYISAKIPSIGRVAVAEK